MLSTSSLQGNLRGQDIAFRVLLGEHGIVSLGEDTTNSVGRKWRSALGKMGFLYPEIPDTLVVSQTDLGQVDTITPNGWRLIRLLVQYLLCKNVFFGHSQHTTSHPYLKRTLIFQYSHRCDIPFLLCWNLKSECGNSRP